jgi:hypothetical protein
MPKRKPPKAVINVGKKPDGIAMVQIILAVFLLVLSFPLMVSPANSFIPLLRTVAVLMLFLLIGIGIAAKGTNKEKTAGKVFSILIFIIAQVLSMQAAQPDFVPAQSAKDQAAEQSDQIAFGQDLAVQKQGKKITDEQAQSALDSKFADNSAGRVLAGESYKLSLADQNPDKVADRLVKFLPVESNKWSCNQFGCSYSDDKIIWTISSANLWGSMLLMGVSLAALIFVANRD